MSDFIGSLDLGQSHDPSALAVLQKDGEAEQAQYTLLVLRRFELKTPYTEVVDETGRVMTTGALRGSPLAVDATGVGRPVCDLARERLTQTPIWPVVVTGGHAATRDEDGTWRVPKKVLVSSLALVHQTGRLIVPRKLTHGPTLAREMENFKAKITASANETFEAWRSGQHDDLVFAVALGVWAGERFCCGPCPPPDPSARLQIAVAPKGFWHSDRPDDDDDWEAEERGKKPGGEGQCQSGGAAPLWPESW